MEPSSPRSWIGIAVLTACAIGCSVTTKIESGAPVPDKSAGDPGGFVPDVDAGDAGPSQGPLDGDASDWAFVYGRFFGPGTPGHCGNSGCHAQIRSGFACGSSKDDCYAGLLAAGLIDLEAPAFSQLGDPKATPLAWFSTDTDGNPATMPIDGKMPNDDAVGNAEAADAVTRWLALGAKNARYVEHTADAGTDAPTETPDAGLDSGKDAPDAKADGAAGPTWTSLYNAYFGPGTPGHCGNSGCHSAIRSGFKCGTTKANCFSGLVSAGLVNPANPAQSTLGNLSTSPLAWFGGPMPKDSAVANAAAAQAVTAWLNAGATNN